MGGEYIAQLRLKRERKEKLRLLYQISNTNDSIQGIRLEIHSLVEAYFSGSHASEERAAALEWICRASPPSTLGTDPDISVCDITQLQAALAERTQVLAEGLSQLQELSPAIGKAANQVAKRLIEVRHRIAAHRITADKWFPNDVKGWDDMWKAANQLLDEEQFSEVSRMLDAIEESISRLSVKSDELAQQERTCRFALKALRQVLCEMGVEVISLTREKPGCPTSRILLRGRTPDRGPMNFALSLDGQIASDAQPGRCFRDMQTVKELLTNQGVETDFQPEKPTELGPRGAAAGVPAQRVAKA